MAGMTSKPRGHGDGDGADGASSRSRASGASPRSARDAEEVVKGASHDGRIGNRSGATGSQSSTPATPGGPPWPARDDIPGPARGKDLNPPHNRHTVNGARHGEVKPENSMILRGNEDSVRRDVSEIAAGNAQWNPQTGRYEINGRTYGVEQNGTVFPDSGPGIVKLDRNEYAALKEIARADGDVSKVNAFTRHPRFVNNPDAIATAKSIYDGTYPE